MTKIDDLSSLPKNTYVSFAQNGNCKVCGRYKDLRMGSCFGCVDKVSGRKVPNGHELWETANPNNRWAVIEQ